MASRASRYISPVLRSGFRSSQTAFRASGRRGMATTTSPSTQSGDMPWIIGSGLIFVPTVFWILSSGKEEKHAHHAQKAPQEHVKVAEAVKEAPEEPAPEPPVAEPTPEPASKEKPVEEAPEPSTSESVLSDDEGVLVSKEEVEESINKAVDADVPKEAKGVEAAEPTSPKPAPTLSVSESMKDSETAVPPKEETTEPAPPQASEDASAEGTKSQ